MKYKVKLVFMTENPGSFSRDFLFSALFKLQTLPFLRRILAEINLKLVRFNLLRNF